MVLTFIADVVLDVGYWSTKQIINVGYWVLWGTPRTKEEIMLEEQNKTIKSLQEDISKMAKVINKISDGFEIVYSEKCNKEYVIVQKESDPKIMPTL